MASLDELAAAASEPVVHSLVVACANAGRTDEALALLRKRAESGLPTPSNSYHALLRAVRAGTDPEASLEACATSLVVVARTGEPFTLVSAAFTLASCSATSPMALRRMRTDVCRRASVAQSNPCTSSA